MFEKLFGRRKPSALQFLQSARWKCASCDVEHEGMFDIGSRAQLMLGLRAVDQISA